MSWGHSTAIFPSELGSLAWSMIGFKVCYQVCALLSFANYAAQKIVEIMDGTHRSGSKMYTSYSDLTSYPCSCFFVQKGKYVTKSSCCDVSAWSFLQSMNFVLGRLHHLCLVFFFPLTFIQDLQIFGILAYSISFFSSYLCPFIQYGLPGLGSVACEFFGGMSNPQRHAPASRWKDHMRDHAQLQYKWEKVPSHLSSGTYLWKGCLNFGCLQLCVFSPGSSSIS